MCQNRSSMPSNGQKMQSSNNKDSLITGNSGKKIGLCYNRSCSFLMKVHRPKRERCKWDLLFIK